MPENMRDRNCANWPKNHWIFILKKWDFHGKSVAPMFIRFFKKSTTSEFEIFREVMPFTNGCA